MRRIQGFVNDLKQILDTVSQHFMSQLIDCRLINLSHEDLCDGKYAQVETLVVKLDV